MSEAKDLEAQHVSFVLSCKIKEVLRQGAAGWYGTIKDASGAAWQVSLERCHDATNPDGSVQVPNYKETNGQH